VSRVAFLYPDDQPAQWKLFLEQQAKQHKDHVEASRIVRRDKSVLFSRRQTCPGTGSLHLVTIEAASEATKTPELSMQRAV